MKTPALLLLGLALLATGAAAATPAKIRVLIVDGQNNHTVWPKSTAMMKAYLEATGKFEVSVARTRFAWKGEKWLAQYPAPGGRAAENLPEPKADPEFTPDFSKHDVVISNYNGERWPAAVEAAFLAYVKNGGGFVSYHAANNAFPDWPDYNAMIGLGGWGGRNEKDGPYVYYDAAGKLVRDTSPGNGGAHGPQHEFVIETRAADHPIMRGLPRRWRHTQDECYDRLRGPAENMTVLATAFSSPEFKGTNRHEPALMVIEHGKGRVFHTILGHEDYSFEGVGFITTFLRGVEWAATGKVTISPANDWPSTKGDAEHMAR